MIMSKHLTDEELLSLLEGDQSEPLEKHLNECGECSGRLKEFRHLTQAMAASREAKPSDSLRWDFLAAIEEEKKSLGRSADFAWLKIAAVVTLAVVSFLLGKWSVTDQSEKIAAIENEVAQLRNASLQQLATSSSASQRITAVNQMEKVGADRNLVMTLIKILNSDESPNVRYAAVQALGKMLDDELVRNQLVKALEVQSDPLIQIALITILTEADEKSAIAPVKDLIKDEKTSPEVKRQAEIALQILI